MDHHENTLLKRFPIIKYALGILLGIGAIYYALEWNESTDSYWGFVYLILVVPGILYILNKINKSK